MDKTEIKKNILTGEEAQKVLGEILESERRSRSLTFPAHTGAQGLLGGGVQDEDRCREVVSWADGHRPGS